MTKKGNGYVVVGILRAHKTDGSACLVVTSKYKHIQEDVNLNDGVTTGVGAVLSFMKYLSDKDWLSKDYVMVFSGEPFGHSGVKHWLAGRFDNHVQHTQGDLHPDIGDIVAAINLDIHDAAKFEAIAVRTEGTNGILPNLDLVNLVVRMSHTRYGQSKISFAGKSSELSNRIQPALASLVPPARLDLITFMVNAAFGEPTGDHGMFSKYHIDSVTLENKSPSGNKVNGKTMAAFVEILEGTLRSLNNLIEHLNHAFHYYLILSSTTFVPIAHYFIPLGLIILGYFGWPAFILMQALSVNLLYASGFVISSHVAGGAIFSFPIMARKLAYSGYIAPALATDENIIYAWIIFTAVIVIVLFWVVFPFFSSAFKVPRDRKYKDKSDDIVELYSYEDILTERTSVLSALSTIPGTMFIGCASLVNFSFCFLSAVVIVPAFGFLHATKNSLSRTLQLILLTILSPPGLLILFALYNDMTPFSVLLRMVQGYEAYGTLIHPFFCCVYTPLVILQIMILLRK